MTPSPILKVLSSIQRNGVRALLMGGQACVLYGGAEFSRDTDLVADPEPVIAKLAGLLPGRFTPGPAVTACVKPALFRNRG